MDSILAKSSQGVWPGFQEVCYPDHGACSPARLLDYCKIKKKIGEHDEPTTIL